MKITIDEDLLKEYIRDALKYRALYDYGVTNWIHYYDALDIYKNEEYDLVNDDYMIIEDYSKLVNEKIKLIKGDKINDD